MAQPDSTPQSDPPPNPAPNPLELARSSPSAPPTHFRKPHVMHPLAHDFAKTASRITWYNSGIFWGLAALEVIVAGGIGLWTRHWMGPDFLLCLGSVWLIATMLCWIIRSVWRDEWLVRMLGLCLFEFVAIARLLTSAHPGVKRYEYMILMVIIGGLAFLIRAEDDYDENGRRRRRWWRGSGWGGSWGGGSWGGSGGSSGGGGGCGG